MEPRETPQWGPGAGGLGAKGLLPHRPQRSPWKGALGEHVLCPSPCGGEFWNLPSWGDHPPPTGRRCSCPGSSRTRQWRRRPATAWATRTRCCKTTSAPPSTTYGTCSSPRSWPTGACGPRRGAPRSPLQAPGLSNKPTAVAWTRRPGSEAPLCHRPPRDPAQGGPARAQPPHQSATPPTEWDPVRPVDAGPAARSDPWRKLVGGLCPSARPVASLNAPVPPSLHVRVNGSLYRETGCLAEDG